MIIHREVFDDIGLFDENLPACEDYDLWLRVCARYPVGLIETPLVRKYGGHEDQLSRLHPAMDRYRILALLKIISQAEALQAEDHKAACQMLIKKGQVYLQGARRRGRHDEAARLASHIEAAIKGIPC